MMLGPVLNMINGPVVGDALRDPNNRIAKLVATEKDDSKVVEDLYLAVLCRPPTEKEMQEGLKAIKDGEADFDGILAEANRRKAALAEHEKAVDAKQVKWEADLKATPVWSTPEVVSAVSAKGATLTPKPDGSILASGPNEGDEVYTVTLKTNLQGVTAIRLEALPDDSLPAKGPGRAKNGNFVLSEIKVEAKPEGDADAEPQPLVLQNAQADFSQDQWAVAGAIDGNEATGWAIAPQFGKPHVAVFEVKDPVSFAGGAVLTVSLVQKFPGKDHNLGKFRLSATTAPKPVALNGPPEAIAKLLNVEPEKRTPEQQAELTRYFRSLDPELAHLQKQVADYPAPVDRRQPGAQDLVWALLNSKAFQFNH
jgi:hypothetical protein